MQATMAMSQIEYDDEDVSPLALEVLRRSNRTVLCMALGW